MAIMMLLVVAGSIVVYVADPEDAVWLPKCPLHALTGLDCPTCGSTRALHHILHGEVARGLAFNPAAPVLWLLAAGVVMAGFRESDRRPSALMRWLAGAYIAVYLAWGLTRNLL